jgi:hypothetical protein
MKNKGQLYAEWLTGLLGGVVAIGMLYVLLNQVYLHSLRDEAVRRGVNAANLGYIDTAWELLLIPVGIAVFYGMVSAGRRYGGRTSYEQ